MTRKELTRNYWRYYRMLEDKFRETIDYVEIATTNFFTYSNEFAKMTIGGWAKPAVVGGMLSREDALRALVESDINHAVWRNRVDPFTLARKNRPFLMAKIPRC